MSDTPKKQKRGRNQRQKQIPEKESARIVPAYFDLNTDFVPLAVCDSTGNFLCLLNNKPHQPYQKPAVAFCKINPALHYLLANLKTAQSFLLLQTQQLSASLPEYFDRIGVEYECDMAFQLETSSVAFRNWLAAHPNRPLLISGIGIMDSAHRTSRLNLDLTLPSTSEHDYSKNFSPLFFEPLQIAICAYNDAITMLFEHSYLVFPVHFLHELASVLLHIKKPEIQVFDI
jgi:hypothetical protein